MTSQFSWEVFFVPWGITLGAGFLLSLATKATSLKGNSFNGLVLGDGAIKEREKMRYLIIYDLISPSQNYNALYKALKIFPEHIRITESCWVIREKNVSVIKLREYLSQYLDYNDKLFVTKISEFSHINLPAEAINILK